MTLFINLRHSLMDEKKENQNNNNNEPLKEDIDNLDENLKIDNEEIKQN